MEFKTYALTSRRISCFKCFLPGHFASSDSGSRLSSRLLNNFFPMKVPVELIPRTEYCSCIQYIRLLLEVICSAKRGKQRICLHEIGFERRSKSEKGEKLRMDGHMENNLTATSTEENILVLND
jgi:hypothetical protein